MEKQIQSAIKIQRAYRKYILKKKECSDQANDTTNAVKCSLNDLERLKLDTKYVLEEVPVLYQKIFVESKKKHKLRKLNSNINELSSKLKTITRLQQCAEIETSFSGNFSNEAKKRHEIQLQQTNLKWWEKLDIFDT